MRIFNLDAHCAVIEDDKRFLNTLGYQVTSHNMTGHAFVFDRQPCPSFGKFKLDYIWDYTPKDMKNEHGERLKDYDAFFGTYPPLLIRKFEEFGKPMVLHLPVRYDLWASDNRERWYDWHQWFGDNVRAGKLHVSANSLYDVHYCHYFTGIMPTYIPSMCDYTNVTYSSDGRGPLLMDSRSEQVSNVFFNELGIEQIRRKYGRYSWKEIVKHKCFVWVPYNASIMSFFEHYSSNVPLFVPTPEFMIELKLKYGAISEITHRQCSNHYPPGSFGKGTYRAPDPNEYDDPESLMYWTQWWDMYNLPYIQYFGSFQELKDKLATVDYGAISAQMAIYNAARKPNILGDWKTFMETVK